MHSVKKKPETRHSRTLGLRPPGTVTPRPVPFTLPPRTATRIAVIHEGPPRHSSRACSPPRSSSSPVRGCGSGGLAARVAGSGLRGAIALINGVVAAHACRQSHRVCCPRGAALAYSTTPPVRRQTQKQRGWGRCRIPCVMRGGVLGRTGDAGRPQGHGSGAWWRRRVGGTASARDDCLRRALWPACLTAYAARASPPAPPPKLVGPDRSSNR